MGKGVTVALPLRIEMRSQYVLLGVAALFLPLVASASFANHDPNNPLTGFDASSQTVGGFLNSWSQDSSTRVINGNNAGSATLIGRRSNITINGDKYHKLSFVTADHVMTGRTLNSIGFEGSQYFDPFTLLPVTVGRFTANVGAAANWQYDHSLGLRDMGFLGVTLKYSSLTAGQNKYLEQLSALEIGVVGDDYRGAARSYGYGVSGTYQYDIAFNKIGFVTTTDRPFGTHRYVNHNVLRGGNVITSGGTYNYGQLSWNCSATIGEGQLAPGDSGGSFVVNGKLAGVNTYVQSTTSALYGTYYAYGLHGGAYRLTADDKTWLLQSAATYQAVPEPGTIAALGLGLATILRRRKKAA